MMRRAMGVVLAATLGWVAPSCGTGLETDRDESVEMEGADPLAEKADSVTLRYTTTPGILLPTAKIQAPGKRVFKTASSFKRYFGIEAPGIDFTRYWMIFYTPGTATPELASLRGWRATVRSIRTTTSGLTLNVTTRLELPGNCAPSRTQPYLLAWFPKPAGVEPSSTKYYRDDLTRACDASLLYFDGVAFTGAEAADALRAANRATKTELLQAGVAGAPAAIIVAGRPWASLLALSATAGIGAGTMQALRELGRDESTGAYELTVARAASLAAAVRATLAADDTFMERVESLVSDATGDTERVRATRTEAFAVLGVKLEAAARSLVGTRYASEAAAREVILEAGRTLQAEALANYPRGLLGFVTPKTHAEKLALAKAAIAYHFEHSLVHTDTWRLSINGSPDWDAVKERVMADLAAFETGPGYGEMAAGPYATVFYSRVYGLHSEATIDDVGKMTFVLIEID